MKHRADVLQVERPGSNQPGGRHAVAKGRARGKALRPFASESVASEADRVENGTVATETAVVETLVDSRPEAVATALLVEDRKLDRELDPAPETRSPGHGDLPVDAPVDVHPTTVVERVDPEPASTVLETVPAHRPAEAATNPTDVERAASPLASVGKWRTRNLLRNLTFVLLVGAAGATGLAGRYYFESTTDSRMRLLVTSCLLVAGLWALLTATAPQVVTLKGSVLTVKSHRGTDRFDLAEGMTQLELIGDPASSKWALVLHRGDNTVVRLGRRDVDARTLDPLVRKFREIAERRRSEHWARLGL